MKILRVTFLQLCKSIYFYVRRLLQDILSPPLCFFCREFIKKRDVFCSHCSDAITPIVSTTVAIAKKHNVKVFAVSDYKDPVRALILAKGYSDIVASRKLGELIWDMTYVKNVEFDYIVPIPLHYTRFASRGFNQAQEIASILSQKSGKPVANILIRKKITKRQSELSQEKRFQNVKDAFVLKAKNKSVYRGKHILLVDDLMTTGSTIKSASKRLLETMPQAVTVAVACRVV